MQPLLHYFSDLFKEDCSFQLVEICACRVIRAPIPWHEMFVSLKKFNSVHLFLLNPMMFQLQRVWCSRYLCVYVSVSRPCCVYVCLSVCCWVFLSTSLSLCLSVYLSYDNLQNLWPEKVKFGVRIRLLHRILGIVYQGHPVIVKVKRAESACLCLLFGLLISNTSTYKFCVWHTGMLLCYLGQCWISMSSVEGQGHDSNKKHGWSCLGLEGSLVLCCVCVIPRVPQKL